MVSYKYVAKRVKLRSHFHDSGPKSSDANEVESYQIALAPS